MSPSMYWFRNDLRTTDNPGLAEACAQGTTFGVYCFNPYYYRMGDFGFPRTGPFRAAFLLESVTALRQDLHKLGIPLFVFHAPPEKVIPELAVRVGAGQIHYQREWTRDEQLEQELLQAALPEPIALVAHTQQFLYNPEDIPFHSPQAIPEIFTEFRKQCEKSARVRPLVPAPKPQQWPADSGPEGEIPSLSHLGLSLPKKDTRTAFPFGGGASQAWERLEDYFWKRKKLTYYKRTRNGMLGPDYSSKFSPWLANGALSPREIYWEVQQYQKEVVKNQDTYWLVFELIWRDYFKYISLKHGDRIFFPGGIRSTRPSAEPSNALLQVWTRGETQNAFVNAHMRELALTGWMSNRGRQNVASYWSRTLGQDWRLGAAWFQYLLLDYDVHSNWGNWMYASGVGNDPRDRTFNPDLQASRYDPEGRYRRLWLQPSLFDTPSSL